MTFLYGTLNKASLDNFFGARLCEFVCFYLCTIRLWINRVWFNMVPTELIPLTPPLRPELGNRLRLPVQLPLRLPSHCLRAGPRRLLPLPVGRPVCQTWGQLVPLWVHLLAHSGPISIPSQDLDLVAVFLWRDVAATGWSWVAMESNLMASWVRGDGFFCWGGSWRGHRLWWWVSLSWLVWLVPGWWSGLVHRGRGEARSSFWTADDTQVLSVGAVIDSPPIGTAFSNRQLIALAAHIVQPDQT